MPIAGAAAIGAIGSIGASLLGGGKGSGGSTQQQTSTAPWAAQQPYLQQGFSDASNIMSGRYGQGPFQGEYYAPNNATQGDAINQAAGWAQGAGSTLPGQVAGTASTLQGAAPGFVQNASNMAANGAGQQNPILSGVLNAYATGMAPATSVNGQLSNSLNRAAVGSANTLGNFASGQQQVMQQGLSDPTQRLANDAGSYMNSSPVQGAINSTNAQIDQTLNEQTVPGLNRQAAMGGTLNSSRAGMAEAMANEGAGIAKGNADASILNNAYNTGLGAASSTYNQGLNTANSAATNGLVGNSGIAQGQQNYQLGQSEFGTNTALNAANSGLSSGLGYQTLNANTMLGANNQLGSAANMGMSGAGQAANLATSNYNLGAAAGGLQQQGQQALDNQTQSQWNEDNTYDQNVLSQYMQTIGGNYGSQASGSGSSTLPPNLAGNLFGGAVAGAGLYNNFTNNGTYASGGSVTNAPAYIPPSESDLSSLGR